MAIENATGDTHITTIDAGPPDLLAAGSLTLDDGGAAPSPGSSPPASISGQALDGGAAPEGL